jgi:hypothetical protein
MIAEVEQSLGRGWRRHGFARFINKVHRTLDHTRYGWTPDSWRPRLREHAVEVIEVGQNSESKWDAIAEVFSVLDYEHWSLRMYCISKDIPKLTVIEGEILARCWVRKLIKDQIQVLEAKMMT